MDTTPTSKLDYVCVRGSGDRIIVFLHGFMSSKKYWRRVIRKFDMSEVTTVSIDLLGFGSAPKPRGRYGYKDHVDHIRKTLHSLDLTQKDITLVGHSMGALIAARYANLHSSHVKSLGMINPPIYISYLQARSIILSTGFHYRLLLTSRFRRGVWWMLRSLMIFPGHNSTSRERSLESIVMASEFIDDVAFLKMRSILTIGTRDRGIYLENMQKIHSIDSIMSVMIDETGHHTALTHPTLLATYIKDLL
jgi:pimeloyl-ACP methyl ester carboxylesterase